MEGRLVIFEFDEAIGQPLRSHAKTYVGHCGYLVRDRIPISAREWKKKPSAPHISFVSDRDKANMWTDIGLHFRFNMNDDELKERIREWTMKNMATLGLEEELVRQVFEEERDAKFQHQGVCQAKALLG